MDLAGWRGVLNGMLPTPLIQEILASKFAVALPGVLSNAPKRLENEITVGDRIGRDYFWDGNFARYATNLESRHSLETASQLPEMSCFPIAEPGSNATCATGDGGSRKWIGNPGDIPLRCSLGYRLALRTGQGYPMVLDYAHSDIGCRSLLARSLRFARRSLPRMFRLNESRQPTDIRQRTRVVKMLIEVVFRARFSFEK